MLKACGWSQRRPLGSFRKGLKMIDHRAALHAATRRSSGLKLGKRLACLLETGKRDACVTFRENVMGKAIAIDGPSASGKSSVSKGVTGD